MNGDDDRIVYFGRTSFRGFNKLFGIKKKDRRQHMYIVGKSGTGKSVLLYNMIVQDIFNNEGLCVIDPHGELAESLLDKIPQTRINDVIYFNPAELDYCLGFNILELPDEKYKNLISSSLMSIFTKIWSNVWSARMEYILNNAILALLDTPGSTLLGINRILVDKDYRQLILNNVKDPIVKSFWINEFEQWKDQFRNEAIAPIQNKVGQFLSTPLIRNIVGQSKSTINIFEAMNQKKILILNLSKGRIGEDNSALLGSLFITKIQLATMERIKLEEDERSDFYLYIDEFQNFATESFADILSEARKFKLNLIIAHQYIEQLTTDLSERVKNAVFGNVGTMVVFRVGAKDAQYLEKEFYPEISVEDLVNLPNFNVYIKLMVDGVAVRPFSAITLPPFQLSKVPKLDKDFIINTSYQNYTKKRSVVEEEIFHWINSRGVEIEKKCEKCGKVFFTADESINLCDNCLALTKKVEKEKINLSYYYDLAKLGIEFKMNDVLVQRKFRPYLKNSRSNFKRKSNFFRKKSNLNNENNKHHQNNHYIDDLKKEIKESLKDIE